MGGLWHLPRCPSLATHYLPTLGRRESDSMPWGHAELYMGMSSAISTCRRPDF